MSCQPSRRGPRVGRRTLLTAGAVAAAGGIGATVHHLRRQPVFIARRQRYDGNLARTIEDGLQASEIDPQKFRGKRVLLKPNLVEPSKDSPQLTTHPSVVAATAEVFRRHGAEVSVGEGPGTCGTRSSRSPNRASWTCSRASESNLPI